jgi:hypothetical protein
MGDFSIRCSISGVPIPCNTDVLVIKMQRSVNHPEYRYPVSMPVPGLMGSYGYVDDVSDHNDNDKVTSYLHVLPNLWKAAGDIWERGMFGNKVPSLTEEIEAEREKYRNALAEYAQFKDSGAYESLVELRMNDGGEWLRRLKNIVLFAPDFGKTNPIYTGVLDMIKQKKAPAQEEIEKLHDLIAAFMSSGITGVSLGGGTEGGYPFEQYPELKWDLLWHQAIVKEIKLLRTEIHS